MSTTSVSVAVAVPVQESGATTLPLHKNAFCNRKIEVLLNNIISSRLESFSSSNKFIGNVVRQSTPNIMQFLDNKIDTSGEQYKKLIDTLRTVDDEWIVSHGYSWGSIQEMTNAEALKLMSQIHYIDPQVMYQIFRWMNPSKVVELIYKTIPEWAKQLTLNKGMSVLDSKSKSVTLIAKHMNKNYYDIFIRAYPEIEALVGYDDTTYDFSPKVVKKTDLYEVGCQYKYKVEPTPKNMEGKSSGGYGYTSSGYILKGTRERELFYELYSIKFSNWAMIDVDVVEHLESKETVRKRLLTQMFECCQEDDSLMFALYETDSGFHVHIMNTTMLPNDERVKTYTTLFGGDVLYYINSLLNGFKLRISKKWKETESPTSQFGAKLVGYVAGSMDNDCKRMQEAYHEYLSEYMKMTL